MTDTTTKSIRIRGRDYSVEQTSRTTATGTIETGYKITGKRGAVYSTMRNVPRPERLFVISQSLGSTVMQGVWLSDEGGTLRVINQ